MQSQKRQWLLVNIQLCFIVGCLLQVTSSQQDTKEFNGTCEIESPWVVEEFPSLVSVRNPQQVPGYYNTVMCGGVLINPLTIMTAATCLWREVKEGQGIRHDIRINPINNTFGFLELNAAIAPLCTQGEGLGLESIVGYEIMKEYDGWQQNGNALGLLYLNESIPYNISFPEIRNFPMDLGSKLIMVGHGERPLQYEDKSYTAKKVQYQTISDQVCRERLSLWPDDGKELKNDTESCAVVIEEGSDIGVCTNDDGNPLFDEDGNLAGIVTWWSVNDCDVNKTQNMPLIYADLAKIKNQQFLNNSHYESMFTLPNVVEGCEDGAFLSNEEFTVSIQVTRYYDNTLFTHVCGGVLISNGTRVLTAAQCIWNIEMTPPWDVRAWKNNKNRHFGEPATPMYASLAPLCRHQEGIEKRMLITNYRFPQKYKGKPSNGNDIAVLDLEDGFSPELSFPYFEETLQEWKQKLGQVQNARFIGWGAENDIESKLENDDSVYKNNYFPAKNVSLEVIEKINVCKEELVKRNNQNELDDQTHICANFTKTQGDIQGICVYDNGGPLVGVTEVDGIQRTVLVGIKSWKQDRQCIDTPSLPQVFTNVYSVRNFLLEALDLEPKSPPSPPPPLASSLNSPPPPPQFDVSVVVVIACVVGFLLLVLLFVGVRWCAQKRKSNIFLDFKALPEVPTPQELNNLHSILSFRLKRSKSRRLSRAHSDLATSLAFALQHEKLEIQKQGFNQFIDDNDLCHKHRQLPQSPFVVQALQQSNWQLVQDKYFPNWMQLDSDQETVTSQNSASSSFKYSQQQSQNEHHVIITSDVPISGNFNIDCETELKMESELGRGAFGKVHKAKWIPNNCDVAVKVIHPGLCDKVLKNTLTGELSVLCRVNSPYIMKCYGACLKLPHLCLVFEYAANGDLSGFIHRYPGKIPEKMIMRIAWEIARGLSVLHPTVVHRDLKPDNVLLDEKYKVKLADFGLSKMKENTYLTKETHQQGTPAYMAPEVLQGKGSVDEKCDMYALGIIIWEMYTKEKPWKGFIPVQIVNQVLNLKNRPQIPADCPDCLKDLMERCWAQDPQTRPSAEEFCNQVKQCWMRINPRRNLSGKDSLHFILKDIDSLKSSSQQSSSQVSLSGSFRDISIQDTGYGTTDEKENSTKFFTIQKNELYVQSDIRY
eukprot:TRINITY_DN8124_c0_g1_i1.p1 TRINITY_DN8124_c0_g1~~TRINITY_DN8124_c0_g1_i1.p1  ORF type:complete len:1161 (+),score=110.82 TRINITY_DN8124_c0_g1_i1:144-3626(+)